MRDESGRRFARTLRVTTESDRFLGGIEVNRYGQEIAPKGVDERLHLIDKTLIVGAPTELRMSHTYGEFARARRRRQPGRALK